MIYECFDGQKNKCMKEHGYLPDFIQDQMIIADLLPK